jgi:uncharacterized secreted protein with C-terminal beta-propeller domain
MALLTNGLSINCFCTKITLRLLSLFLVFFIQIKASKLKGFMSYFQQVTNIYKHTDMYMVLRIWLLKNKRLKNNFKLKKDKDYLPQEIQNKLL